METHVTSGIHSPEGMEDWGPHTPSHGHVHRDHKKPTTAARSLYNGHREYTTPHCPQGTHHDYHKEPTMVVIAMAVTGACMMVIENPLWQPQGPTMTTGNFTIVAI